MNNKIIILFLIICITIPVFAANYSVHRPDKLPIDEMNESERVLFILDFSNSMSEYLEGRRKVDLMIDTMKSILPNLNPDISVGLRVYGHRMGLTPFEACRASTLVSPISVANGINIRNSLLDIKPRGMTPITYSLKQAVKKDFLGFSGKKHIILLTDGGENCDESPCTYVLELIKTRKDISIDVIQLGNDNRLACLANETGGTFHKVNRNRRDFETALETAFNVPQGTVATSKYLEKSTYKPSPKKYSNNKQLATKYKYVKY